MIYCLNPECQNPQNPDHNNFCQSCGQNIIALLRNRYHIINMLGEGGFGRTFLAEDRDKLNEKCVVKQLAPNVQGSAALGKTKQLFEDEAKRLQQLGNHPQIPSLFAYFEDYGRLYLVQEWIDGEDLQKELERAGIFNEQKIRDLLNDILGILEVVHQQNVIHRDIKPVNIMRRKSDQKLVLIDFGVSKQMTASAIMKPGTRIGSLGYAPIEQMQGGEAYPASDLFSLGATCFHLLTGIHPHQLFLNEGYGWVKNWQQHLRQSISNNLAEVLDKLLQKNYLQRYQSATEAKNVLNYVPPSPTVIPSQVKATHTPPVQPQVNPTIISKNPTPHQNKNQPSVKPRTSKLKWIGGLILLTTLIGGWIYCEQTYYASPISVLLPLKRTLTGHSAWVNSVAISPDGRTLASGSSDKTIKIWRVK